MVVVPIHPAVLAFWAVYGNITLACMMNPMFHPYMDELQRSFYRGMRGQRVDI